ncbi:hypothetical protein [Halomicrococcus sp. NG-SE-24]|uniref:hypothetical protein n=1 Tax=Halomicrococcus sp. NG-SE-24 TaxID=3436928 RepID=UPI003D96B6B8
MSRNDRGGPDGERRPRLETNERWRRPPETPGEREPRRRTADESVPRFDRPADPSPAELRAVLRSLERRLADAESKLEALEAAIDARREDTTNSEALRACRMCGRVCVRYGVDERCPYCDKGRLRPL